MEVVKFDSKVSWTVAISCAFLNFLVMIPTKVSGLFFVEILDRYQVLRNLAGYPAFTISLMRCSGGPFAGYFAERFGINQVLILGSLLAAAGISACFFAKDIAVVIVSLGFIHGFGTALTNTFLPQIVKIHFRKHLTLAIGITQSGACLGAFLSPPLLLWIFRNYGTSGGFLIIGAIVLNGLPIVLFLNILSPNKLFNNKSGDSMKSESCLKGHLEMRVTTTVTSSEDEDYNKTNNLQNKAVAASVLKRPPYDYTGAEPDRADPVALNPSNELTMRSFLMKETGSEAEKKRMEPAFAEYGRTSEGKPKNTFHEKKTKVATDEKINELQYDFNEKTILEKALTNNCEENLLHPNNCSHAKTEYQLKAGINNKDTLQYLVEEVKECFPSSDTPTYASGSNISAPSYLINQERIQHQITIENLPISLGDLNERSIDTNEPNNQEIKQKEVFKVAKQLSIGSTNAKKSFKIFLDVTYWIVIITQSVLVFILVIFWTTMIDFSRDKKLDRSKEVYLLMILPISEIIGRLGLGWITDGKYLTRINFCIISFILLGCSCSLMAWAQGFYVVMTSIFMFGIISSGLITVFPMIIFEFFDSTKQTMGQASRFCLFGPLSFLNGPLIGYFRGTLGSYSWLYNTIGVASLVCAALSALIPVLARMRNEKKNKRR